MAAPSLVLGAFSLTQQDGSTRVLAEGTSRGTPVPLNVAIKTWLQDGAIVVTQGYDNREVSVRVRIFGADQTAIAAKEALLFAELGKPNTLTWIPTSGPTAVFNVVTSSMDPDDSDDEGEGQAVPWSTYILKLTCEAFTRSASDVLTTPLVAPGSPSTVTVDDGTATTGWSGSGTVSTSGGAVLTSLALAADASGTVSLTKTTSIDTSVTNYLIVDWKTTSATGHVITQPPIFYGDGSVLQTLTSTRGATAGYTRTYLSTTKAAYSTLTASVLAKASGVADTVTLSVDIVIRTNVPVVYGTARQKLRTLNVLGSARTQGTLAVEHDTTALGTTLVYTFPDNSDGYAPPCRNFRVSGPTVTTDSARASGAREVVGNAPTTAYRIPLANVPDGLYDIVALISASAAGTKTLTTLVQTVVASDSILAGQSTISSPVVFAGTAYQFRALGRVQLPNADVPVKTAAGLLVQLIDFSAGTGISVTLDELYLFNSSKGCLTIGPDGMTSQRLWLDSPTVDTPRPRLLQGNATDRSDAYFAAPQAWQPPQFNPPRMSIFTVTLTALDAKVSLRHSPRWHTNPAF